MQRKQFTFYRSFYEAMQTLPDKDRLAAYDAVCTYALDGEEQELSGVVATVFILMKANLDAGRKKAMAGQQGGLAANQSTPEANDKQTESKTKNKTENNKKVKLNVKTEDKTEIKNGSASTGAEAEPVNNSVSVVDVVAKKFETVFGIVLGESARKELAEYTGFMDADCCQRAVEEAKDRGGTGWPYVRGILRKKREQGVKSLRDWDRVEQERRLPARQDDDSKSPQTVESELRAFENLKKLRNELAQET